MKEARLKGVDVWMQYCKHWLPVVKLKQTPIDEKFKNKDLTKKMLCFTLYINSNLTLCTVSYFIHCNAECCYAAFRYAECRYAVCRGAQQNDTRK